MPFPDFDPVLLQLGPLAIRWYALAYVAGILLGWRYALGLLRNEKLWGVSGPPIPSSQLDDLVLWITLGVILGGRLGYVLFYDTALIWSRPLDILKVWEGGMSFHGGLIGVTLALLGFSRLRKIDVLRLGDLVAPCVPIGLFFGRIANFINGELWGRVTDMPWGIVFCNRRLLAANGGVCPAGWAPRHPSQLYEALLEGVVMFVVLWAVTYRAKWLGRPGATAGLFLVLYGLFRVTVETVRNPDLTMPTFPLGLTMGMMLSVPLILLGAWFLRSACLRRPPSPQ